MFRNITNISCLCLTLLFAYALMRWNGVYYKCKWGNKTPVRCPGKQRGKVPLWAALLQGYSTEQCLQWNSFPSSKKSNQNNLVLLFVIFVVIFLFVNSLHQISSSPSNPKRLYPNNLKLRVFAEKDSDASTRFLVRVILTTSRRACSCSHSGIPRLHKDMGLVQDVLLIEDDDIAQ